jgi:S1-C subfamily serine protease
VTRRPVLPGWALAAIVLILFGGGMYWVQANPPKPKLHPLEEAAESLSHGLGLQVESEPDDRGGVQVTGVVSGSPAEATGLRAGDRIVACGDQSVWHTVQLIEVISGPLSSGSPCALLVENDGSYRGVTLGPPGSAPDRHGG